MYREYKVISVTLKGSTTPKRWFLMKFQVVLSCVELFWSIFEIDRGLTKKPPKNREIFETQKIFFSQTELAIYITYLCNMSIVLHRKNIFRAHFWRKEITLICIIYIGFLSSPTEVDHIRTCSDDYLLSPRKFQISL